MIHVDPNTNPVQARVVGVIFALVGFGMAGFGGYQAYRVMDTRQWPEAPCTIVASRVAEQPGQDVEHPYVFETQYRYDWQGQGHIAAAYRMDYHGSAEVAEADRLARDYPVGARRSCRVNPRHPQEAVLALDDPWMPVALLLIMATAALILLRLLVFRRGHDPVRVLRAMGLFVALIGGACLLFLGPPWWVVVHLPQWQPHPCTILASQLRRSTIHVHTGAINAYRVDILFTYVVNGQAYRSNQYNLTDCMTPWYYGKRGILADYPPGAQAECFVNPDDPSEAVLTRHVSVTSLVELAPLLMMLGGLLAAFGPGESHWTAQLRPGRRCGLAALGVVSSLALITLLTMSNDLAQDWRAGRVEVLEVLGVMLMGALTALLYYGFYRLVQYRPAAAPSGPEKGP